MKYKFTVLRNNRSQVLEVLYEVSYNCTVQCSCEKSGQGNFR